MDDLALARARRRLATLDGGELDRLGRSLLVGRHGLIDHRYREVLAAAMIDTGEPRGKAQQRLLPDDQFRKPVEKQTHALERERVPGSWEVISRGSERQVKHRMERLVTSGLGLMRIVPLVRKPREKKGWSVRDADHLPNGTRILLKKPASELHPGMAEAFAAFGAPAPPRHRTGTICFRYFGSGNYMVKIDGTQLSVLARRADFDQLGEGIVDINSAKRRTRR